MYRAQAPKGRIALLAIGDISLQAKSAAAMRGIATHVSGMVRFYVGIRDESKVELAGDHSVFLIRDYDESIAERRRTAPATAEHALSVWSEALGIDWPISHALVCDAAIVESGETPKQAPSMSLTTLRALEETAVNKLGAPCKRAFSAGVLLLTYASLRFPDVQRIRSFEINEDSARGTLLSCKANKQRGQVWLAQVGGNNRFARMGTSFVRHADSVKGMVQKPETSFAFMRLDRMWELVAADGPPPLQYDAWETGDTLRITWRCRREGGGGYTPTRQKNLFPTAAIQLSFDQRELNIVGHWSATSRMPERCDRSAPSNYCYATRYPNACEQAGAQRRLFTYLKRSWVQRELAAIPSPAVLLTRVNRHWKA